MIEITLKDEGKEAFLTYASTAELAAINNPLFTGMAKQQLNSLFKKLNAHLSQQRSIKSPIIQS
ncbi:MAG TPA: hypothetical protein VGL94_01480 [Ktedonobacteraceae bacterium]|jgi:hypothetical protein